MVTITSLSPVPPWTKPFGHRRLLCLFSPNPVRKTEKFMITSWLGCAFSVTVPLRRVQNSNFSHNTTCSMCVFAKSYGWFCGHNNMVEWDILALTHTAYHGWIVRKSIQYLPRTTPFKPQQRLLCSFCPHFGQEVGQIHDYVMPWKRVHRYCPFVRGIYRSSVVYRHKGSLMWSFDVFISRQFDLHGHCVTDESTATLMILQAFPRHPLLLYHAYLNILWII